MFLGSARGSVGDIVFSTVAGRAVARQRNRSPRNPRSVRQTLQRVAFCTPVKFFSRAKANLFTFAFADKKQTESDYNAFISANSRSSVLMTREQVNDSYIANIGSFKLSSGDLPSFPIVHCGILGLNGENYVKAETSILCQDLPSTIGQLSSLILTSCPSYKAGDILTFISLVTDNGVTDEPPYLVTDHEYEPKWIISQIVLDGSSSSPLDNEWYCSHNADGTLGISNLASVMTEEVVACAMIVSRSATSGLRTSSSHLMPSDYAMMAIERMSYDRSFFTESNPWLRMVLKSWGADTAPILSGSLVKDNGEHDFPILMVGADEPNLPLRSDLVVKYHRAVRPIQQTVKIYISTIPGALLHRSDILLVGRDNEYWQALSIDSQSPSVSIITLINRTSTMLSGKFSLRLAYSGRVLADLSIVPFT